MEDFASARTKMVDSQLRTQDVTDYAVLDAMGDVPRERFVPAARRALAYIDQDILLSGSGETARYLMEPASFARLAQLAAIQPTDIVLDVGCGSGYSTAVLARLAGSVVALESDPALAAQATETLSDIGVDNAAVVSGPLAEGHAGEGPYDVIVLEGSVEEVPEGLLQQLKEGGRLVGVVGTTRATTAVIYTRTDKEFGLRKAFNLYVPRIPGFERPKAFVF